MSQSTTTAAFTPAPTTARFTGLAWAALILGIIGIVGSIVPILNNLTALAAVVGLILGFIAIFGTRRVLALTGGVLCVLAIVFTVMAQKSTVASIDKALGGHDPAAMTDVQASGCSIGNDYGIGATHATVTITNHTASTQSYMATISVNDATGARVGEINVISNSLVAGQSAILSGMNATGSAGGNARPGPATCTVASVNRFGS
jgi:hypothetical protein